MPRPLAVSDIVNLAQQNAESAANKEEALFAAMGTIGNDAPLKGFSVSARTLKFNASTMSDRGRKLFNKFEKYLATAVCDDFKYCSKREEVDKALKKYLPEIVKYLIARIPISGKLPKWLATILSLFGIASASVDVVVTFLAAWLIIKGCNELCACKS